MKRNNIIIVLLKYYYIFTKNLKTNIMKTYQFNVVFVNGKQITVTAQGPISAFFLATANAIECGFEYTVDSIFNIDTKDFYTTNKNCLNNLISKK